MAASPTSSSRVADYFFVAGVNDDAILPTYNAARQGNQSLADESLYYHQQVQAAANEEETNTKDAVPVQSSPLPRGGRKRGLSLPASLPVAQPPEEDTYGGVLDHVQTVINNFDKARDFARDNVIAIPSPSLDTTITSIDPSSAKKPRQPAINASKSWRGISDYKSLTFSHSRRRQYSVASIPADNSSSNSSPPLPDPVGSFPNILDTKYTPTILTRYPRRDHTPKDQFPSYAAMFCFPRDISLHYGPTPPPERLHSFIMTGENAAAIHGTCVVFYERLVPSLYESVNAALQEWIKANMPPSTIEYAAHLQGKITEEQGRLEMHSTELASLNARATTLEVQKRCEELDESIRTSQENTILYGELLEPVRLAVCEASQLWVPKAIGLLGKMPWMDLYGDWLRVLLDAAVGVGGQKSKTSIDIKSAVYNLIHEVPLPPPGRFEIGLTIKRRPLFFSRPAMNQVPLLKNFSLFPLFRALSPHLIIAVLETLLSEGKVIFLSRYPGMLSLACESFRYLLFPLYWQFVFIPILPERLLTCLQAPVPYIVGFQGNIDDLQEHVPDDACIVNLDSNTMHQCMRVAQIPERQRRKLQSSLDQYAPLHTRFRVPYGVPLSVQEAFPNSRMLLACSRSKSQDAFTAPCQSRNDSDISDSNSLWSHPTSILSGPLSGFWSNSGSTRSSNDSSMSLPSMMVDMPAPALPQTPGVAMLAADLQANHSSPSLQNSSSHPTSGQVEQTQRNAAPSHNAHPFAKSSLDSTNGVHSTYRRSDPLTLRGAHTAQGPMGSETKGMRRLSALMSKPRAVFQSQEQIDQSMAFSPRSSLQSNFSSGSVPAAGPDYDPMQAHPMPRRIKYTEGHTMVEIHTHELQSFERYRCLCGKQVGENTANGTRLTQTTFMCCQECQLVTHEACVNQILHPCLPACFDEYKVQEVFLRTFASLLYNYRTGFVDNIEDRGLESSLLAVQSENTEQPGILYFSKDRFIKHSDKDTRPFLSHLAKSQMFTQFITDRLCKPRRDPEILMFDEFIKLKLNRSKLRFVKAETPFLNDESYRISQIIWATQPEDKPGLEYHRFPIDVAFND